MYWGFDFNIWSLWGDNSTPICITDEKGKNQSHTGRENLIKKKENSPLLPKSSHLINVIENYEFADGVAA